MENSKALFFAVNVIGGLAVLASYAHGILTHPQSRDALWGTTPDWLRTVNVVSIVLAAIGYLVFTSFLGWRVDADEVRVWGRFGFGAFTALYLLILIPSSLWMPLSFAMLRDPSPGLWWLIRGALVVVGLASIALFAALWSARPVPEGWHYWLALMGLAIFCFQTAILDALLWPADFRAALLPQSG